MMIIRVDGWFEYTDKKSGLVRYGYNCSTEPSEGPRSHGRNHLTFFSEVKYNVVIDSEYEAVCEPVVVAGQLQNRITGLKEF